MLLHVKASENGSLRHTSLGRVICLNSPARVTTLLDNNPLRAAG